MTIEKRIERIEAILDARGLDWDHPRVEEKPANEPPKKWRILEPGEEVQEGDWYADAFYPRQCWPPSKGAWLEVKVDSVKVGEVATSGLVFARPVVEEPAKGPEPEYREPVLPADAGQPCEFSMTERDWYPSLLSGFRVHNNPWISSSQGRWNFARIKKDA